MLKSDIDRDLKEAMLSGDKRLVEILRGMKSAILYKEVADGKRETGLGEDEIVAVLKKEKKSRKEAMDLYASAGETARAYEENYQIEVITKYLPTEATEEQVRELVDRAIIDLELDSPKTQDMGKIIGKVKTLSPNADGSLVAKIVKERLS